MSVRPWSCRSRLAVVLVAVTAGLVPLACGGDDEEEAANGEEAAPTETAPAEETAPADDAAAEEDVEEAVLAYGNAEGSDTCDFVSQEAIDSIGGRERCEEEFEDAAPTEYEIRSVEVSGDEATVDLYRPEADVNETLQLVNEDGEWKVDPR